MNQAGTAPAGGEAQLNEASQLIAGISHFCLVLGDDPSAKIYGVSSAVKGILERCGCGVPQSQLEGALHRRRHSSLHKGKCEFAL